MASRFLGLPSRWGLHPPSFGDRRHCVGDKARDRSRCVGTGSPPNALYHQNSFAETPVRPLEFGNSSQSFASTAAAKIQRVTEFIESFLRGRLNSVTQQKKTPAGQTLRLADKRCVLLFRFKQCNFKRVRRNCSSKKRIQKDLHREREFVVENFDRSRPF